MASYIRKLKDSEGLYVCPATRASAVYFDDDTTLSKLSFHPVGVIYQSTNSTSPASLFGGDWERIQNRFLYGTGTYSVCRTGGETSHTLTESEMPRHQHGTRAFSSGSLGLYGVLTSGSSGVDGYLSSNLSYYTESTGNGEAHNNMPPYYCVNIWRRTA